MVLGLASAVVLLVAVLQVDLSDADILDVLERPLLVLEHAVDSGVVLSAFAGWVIID